MLVSSFKHARVSLQSSLRYTARELGSALFDPVCAVYISLFIVIHLQPNVLFLYQCIIEELKVKIVCDYWRSLKSIKFGNSKNISTKRFNENTH